MFKLLTEQQLLEFINHPAEYYNVVVSMALEVLEYRKAHGPLGCDSLELPSKNCAKDSTLP